MQKILSPFEYLRSKSQSPTPSPPVDLVDSTVEQHPIIFTPPIGKFLSSVFVERLRVLHKTIGSQFAVLGRDLAMQSLIATHVFSKIDSSGAEMKLPQIVVVGSQSTGKSSIIERIVGRDFLPRGTGIVTRMPLNLHLFNCPANDARREKFGVLPSEEFATFGNEDEVFALSDVSKEIERITDEKAGTNKGVVNTPITLNIFSNDMVDLSLVDLPGLTSIAVGDQPEDIPQQIEKMVMEYIENENSIILAVSAANVDIANSVPLQLAKKVDSSGDRTIAVITKLDLVDRGTDATEMLTGVTLPVKLGIVGIINRSQADRDMPMHQVAEIEEAFIRQTYPKIAERHGISYLRSMLSNILTTHIQKCLPDLIDRNPDREIYKIIASFSKLYSEQIFSGIGFEFDRHTKQLSPAAQISTLIHEELSSTLEKIDPMDGLTAKDIEIWLRSDTGLNPRIFPTHSVFTNIIGGAVGKMLKDCLNCAEAVHKKLGDIFMECDVDRVFKRFPKVRNLFQKVLQDLLDKQLDITKTFIQTTIKMHSSYIDTESPLFAEKRAEMEIDEYHTVKPKVVDDEYNQSSEDGDKTIEKENELVDFNPQDMALYIEKLIPAYFETCRDVVLDSIPKICVLHMIRHVQNNINVELCVNVRDKNLASLFSENPVIEELRQQLNAKMKALKHAHNVLDDIRSI
ncbi:Dynamin-1-like protein isoform X2 [Aphelenchoides besseyi]|nr:Dynamin-1-like protein isoform X2 [Aphelenchoides besseyi]